MYINYIRHINLFIQHLHLQPADSNEFNGRVSLSRSMDGLVLGSVILFNGHIGEKHRTHP